MLHGMTFTIPAPATDPTGDAIIKAFPTVTQRKIPMQCQFRPELNQWECEVYTFWERPQTWWAAGGVLVGLIFGTVIGRMGKR